MTTPTAPAPHGAHAAPATTARRRHPWLAAAGYGASVGVLLITLVIACAAIVVPKVTGAVPLSILSDSMAPGMPVGSLAIVRPTMEVERGSDIKTLDRADIRAVNRVDDLLPGDVIAYQPKPSDPTLIVHRITQVTVRASGEREFVTKGDNNASADAPVQDYMVRGEVWYHLPYLGYVNTYLNADGARHTAAVITIAALGYTWAAFLVYRAVKRRTDPLTSPS